MSEAFAALIPDDPLMAQAWVDCLRWAAGDAEAVACYARDTGTTVANLPTDDGVIGMAFVRWFNENIWGGDGE